MSRSQAPRARIALSRFLSALLALWLGGGPALSAMHLALVRHVVCASHGQLVHEHDHAGEATGNAGETPTAATDEGDAAPAEHLHDHCTSPSSATPAATTPLSGVTPAIAPPGAALAIGSAIVPGPVPVTAQIYSFAPKTSPPCARVAA